jgi:enoyl-CoA hydratase
MKKRFRKRPVFHMTADTPTTTAGSTAQIQIEVQNAVGILRLNRPDKLNAISQQMMRELMAALQMMDNDPQIGCMVITGSEKAFAAGADIDQMARATAEDMLQENPFAVWDKIRQIQKPVIAAVSGYCFGGGCELALSCDTIIASESAVFSQPEVNLGIIPGAGGTQRLTRAVGKAKAMAMILSGNRLSAFDAKVCGLVADVYAAESYWGEVMKLAETIAQKPRLAVATAKRCIMQAFEMPLDAAIDAERKAFYALFDTHDKTEGMQAFLEKRPAKFRHQ